MENQLATTSQTDVKDGESFVRSAIVHTQTSCYLIDNVFARFEGSQSIENAKLIVAMHEAIQKAKAFIVGFENDETQTGIEDLLQSLRQFDIK